MLILANELADAEDLVHWEMGHFYESVCVSLKLQGPAQGIMKRVEPCPEDMVGENIHTFHGILKETREKTGRRFYGYFESKEPLDDSIEVA